MKYLVLLAAILALSLSSCREQDIVNYLDSDNGVVLSGDEDKNLGDKNSDKDADKEKEEYLRKIAAELEAMVKTGKITKEQAAERLKAAEKAYDEKMRKEEDDKDEDRGDKDADDYLKKVAAKLKAMVDAGEITPEEARTKYEAIKKAYYEKLRKDKKDKDSDKDADDYLKKVAAKLKAMVDAGEITPEEARAKYDAIKKAYYEKLRKDKGDKDCDKDADDYLKNLGLKLRAAVERGDMTAEEARAMYEKLKREYLEKLRKEKDDKDTDKDSDKDADDYLRNLALKLRAAVESGSMTAEEARVMYERLKREYLEKLRKDNDDKDTDKAKYTRRIVKELVFLDDCDYIVAGTVAYFLGDKLAYTIDYGNGECDNIATKTIGDRVIEFELDKRK